MGHFSPLPCTQDGLHALLNKEQARCGFWEVGYSKNSLV